VKSRTGGPGEGEVKGRSCMDCRDGEKLRFGILPALALGGGKSCGMRRVTKGQKRKEEDRWGEGTGRRADDKRDRLRFCGRDKV